MRAWTLEEYIYIYIYIIHIYIYIYLPLRPGLIADYMRRDTGARDTRAQDESRVKYEYNSS